MRFFLMMSHRGSSPAGTRPACFAGLIYRLAGIMGGNEGQPATNDLRPVQAHAALGAHRRPRSIGPPRRWTPGGPARTGLGLHPLRPPGAGLVRGVDLTTAAGTRLERLRHVLEQRVRRGIDVAPPLIRAGVLIPLVPRNNPIEMLFTR